MPTSSSNASAFPWLRSYYPALDGLRGLAFMMVFAIHYIYPVWQFPILRWGWVGVDLFFVLSGFLITGILYDSLHAKNFFRNFYTRRALRIFPLFYAFWLVVLLATPFMHCQWNRYNLSTVLYLGNFYILAPGAKHFDAAFSIFFYAKHMGGGAPRILTVSHFWSLCVEEQFYCFWPAVVWLVRKRSKLLGLCMAVFVTMPFLRLLYVHYASGSGSTTIASQAIYGSTIFRLDTLLLGAALALWLRETTITPAAMRMGARITALAVPALIVFIYRFYPGDFLINSPFIRTFGYSLIAIAAAAVLILSIDPDSRLQKLLQVRPLAATGRISYGLYFFHGIPMGILDYYNRRWIPHHKNLLVPVIALTFSWVAATLSYRLLETPFLLLKSKLAPTTGSQHPVSLAPANTREIRPHRPLAHA